jgi:VIT1/CCC1 family predicted Fe2+/Mn2+ transporter
MIGTICGMTTEHPHDGRTRTELVASHQPEAIRERLSAGTGVSYLKDFVYGAIDGAVTTFAVVSGVAGAGLSPGIVIVLGVANLVGDGFSMAAGNYLGTNAENQQRDHLREMENRHIDLYPDGERAEVREIFRQYGLPEPQLESIVDSITADRSKWVRIMLREEHGLAPTTPNALLAALVTFGAFLLVGLLPLTPFLLNLIAPGTLAAPYLWSTGMTASAFFLTGAVKSRFVNEHWSRAGGVTLLVGGLAAGLAYGLGLLLRGVVDAV